MSIGLIRPANSALDEVAISSYTLPHIEIKI